LIEESFVSVHLVNCSIDRIFPFIKAFNVLGDNPIISIGVYVSFSNSSFISSFSLFNKSLTSDIKLPSICNHSSLNNEKYETSIFPENFKASTGEIHPLVFISIFKDSRFVISQCLVFSISYFTFNTGEKLASINNTLTSSSFSFNSSILLYPTPFSTLISISKSNQSLSISVMYRSLFKISTPAGVLISQAVTIPALFFSNFNHSIQISFLSIIKSLRFNIISKILSFTPGKLEYS
jgi:hypothetical protein